MTAALGSGSRPTRLRCATRESTNTRFPRLANHAAPISTDSRCARRRESRSRCRAASRPHWWHLLLPLGSEVPTPPIAHLSGPMDRLSALASLFSSVEVFLLVLLSFIGTMTPPLHFLSTSSL